MGRSLYLYSTIAAVIGVLTFQLGILDRPEFHYYENLWWPDALRKQRAPGENIPAPPMYAIVVATHTSDIGGSVERLLAGVKEPLHANEQARLAMAKAAQEYGAPTGAEALSVGVYFDDPMSVKSARWALGWALSVSQYEDLDQYQAMVADKFQLDVSKQEQVRAVRIGPGPVLKARIPWRNMFTPMIAPMLHWKRGFQTFYDGEKEGKYGASNGRSTGSGDDAAISCEIYVTGKDDSMEYIDYVVLMGDTSIVWNDLFPEESKQEKTEVPVTTFEGSNMKEKVA